MPSKALRKSLLCLFSTALSLSPVIPLPLLAHESGPVQFEEDPVSVSTALPDDSVENLSDEIIEESAPSSCFELSDQENKTVPLQGTNEEKLEALRTLFPEGAYWNHRSGTNSYPMENITDTCCEDHQHYSGAVRCNVFDGGAQCAGFAYLCYFKYHGQKRSSQAYSKHITGHVGIRPGDVIRTNGHTAFVWKVNGSELSIFEANYNGRCKITLSRTMDSRFVLDYWTPIQYKVSYSANGGKGTKADDYVNAGVTHPAGTASFTRNGYALGGWTVRRTSTGEDLYQNGSSYQFFSSPQTAAASGYSGPAVLSISHDLSKIGLESGDEILLSASWKEKDYTISFDLQGGSGNIAPIALGFDEAFTIPSDAVTRSGMKLDGWKVRNSKGEYLYSKTGLADKTRRWFASDVEAAKEQYEPVVLHEIGRSLTDVKNEQLVLIAQWIPANSLDSNKPSIPTKPADPDDSNDSNEDVRSVGMHRLYNPNSGEHFYTAQDREKDALVKAGWRYEDYAWYAPQTSDRPVYRLYNANAGDHHYTFNTQERNYLIKAGWKDEGIGWYSAGPDGVQVLRQYNPNAKTGAHNFTTNALENNFLVQHGWQGEGVAWFGLK